MLAAFACLLAGMSGCDRASTETAAPLVFPTMASQQDQIGVIRLRGAGNLPLVTLERQGGTWRVKERQDWPADAALISQYLFVLSQARRSEAKTANPALYSRLGVEPVAGRQAAGTELELIGGGKRWRLLVGHEHAKFDGNYIRVNGEPQSWLTDLPVGFDPDPAAWLDHRLLDLPLTRIEKVSVEDADGKRFSVSSRDDRFRLDDAPSAAMHDSHRGDALASVLEHLQMEDVGAGEVAQPSRTIHFDTVEGFRVSLRLQRIDERSWVSVATALDPIPAQRWFAASAGKSAAPAELAKQAQAWNHRFAGRRFRLPEAAATTLAFSHDDILAGEASP
jgi:hypothetical protein